MEVEPAACRLCGDIRIRCLGAIPDSDYFAGRVLERPIAGGRLWVCDGCESMFRHPVLLPSEYLSLYASGAADEYGSDAGRQDLAIIRTIIAQKTRSGGVLDVGCGAGDFLMTLPTDVDKYGVEPSVEAAAAAGRRGVSVLAPTLAQLSPQAAFDVITIIDVIEHVASPRDLLDQALPHLAPGGILIIATGDAGNVLWRRFFRSRFWYSSFPEHITFPSTKYFQIWQEARGFQSPTIVQLRYRRIPAWQAALHLGSQLAYLVSPWLLNRVGRAFECLRRAPRPRRRFFSPGAPGVFTDHQIVSIQRHPRD
jgi:SAM-dependent methyltransferase